MKAHGRPQKRRQYLTAAFVIKEIINIKMKYIALFISIIMLSFCSCNNNDEPKAETSLPIVKVYLPKTMLISESVFDENYLKLANNGLVVTQLSELPNDPFGFNEAFKSINFSEYTLLLRYVIHDWEIDTYKNMWYRDNSNICYNWVASFTTATEPSSSPSGYYFTRCAILVKKLPENANVRCLMSLGAINWGWE